MSDLKKIEEYMEDQGFMKKSELDGIMQSTRDLTVKDIVDHKNCGDNSCAVCTMKSNIDGTSYERGVKGGIKLGQKFPELSFST